MNQPAVPRQAHDFASLIALEQVGPTRFCSLFSDLDYQGGHMFGGQLVAQALAAAQACLDGRPVHSLHGYYLRRGDVRAPIEFEVEAVRDGRNFSTRRVQAEQAGKLLFEMHCSAAARQDGPLDHPRPVRPDVPPPEALDSMEQLLTRADLADCAEAMERLLPMPLVDLRPIDPERLFRPGSGGDTRVWLRIPSLGDGADPATLTCALAYLQDYWIAYAPWRKQDGAFVAEGPSVASLDSNVWFHRPASSGWMLYEIASPAGAGAMATAFGRLFDRDGHILATAAQEVLYR